MVTLDNVPQVHEGKAQRDQPWKALSCALQSPALSCSLPCFLEEQTWEHLVKTNKTKKHQVWDLAGSILARSVSKNRLMQASNQDTAWGETSPS